MTARLQVSADGLEARVPAGMRKLRRAPRPGEKSRNLGVRLSQKAGADPAGPRPRSQRSHVPGPSPWLRAPAPARVRRHGEQNTARKPTPQRAGAGPGLSACPRGRDGSPASPPRVSRQPRPAPATLCPPTPGPPTPQGRPLPLDALGAPGWQGPAPRVCDPPRAHSSTARARAGCVVSSAAWNQGGTCRCPLAEAGRESIC